MKKMIFILPFLVFAEISWAAYCSYNGEWERMAAAIGYAFLYFALMFALSAVAKKDYVIRRLSIHIRELMRKMETDHANGVKTIKWYMGENKRLAEENKKLLDQVKRFKEIYHINIEETNYNYDED